MLPAASVNVGDPAITHSNVTTLCAHNQADARVLENASDIQDVLMSGQADPKEGDFRPPLGVRPDWFTLV